MLKFRYTFLMVCITWLMPNTKAWSQGKKNVQYILNDSIITKKTFAGISPKVPVHAEADIKNKSANQLLQKLYESGYLAAGIDSSHCDTTECLFYFSSGKQYKWARIGVGNVEESVLRRIGVSSRIYEKKPVSQKTIFRIQDRIVQHYENNGYPFVAVRLDSIHFEDNLLSASLNIEKNGLFLIDSVVIKGESGIKLQYMSNYIGLKSGDYYDESQVQKISNRIRELPFLRETQKTGVLFAGEKANIYLWLENRKANRFDGILGVLPNNQIPGKVILTGDLSAKLVSSFHRGETIDARWRRLQSNTQDLKLGFAYPYFFSTPFGSDLKFDLYKRDTLFINLMMHAGIQYLLSGGNYLKVYVESRRTSLLSTFGMANITVLPQNADVNMLLYGIEYKIEKLDYRLNPRRGFRLLSNAAAGNKKIKQNPGINAEAYKNVVLKSAQVQAVLQFEYFIPLAKRSAIMLGNNSGYMLNRKIFFNELYRIGGLRTLRGFDEESIFASAFSIMTAEYRLLLEQNSYLFLFANGAYYENKSVNPIVWYTPLGFGAGISFETKAGIFSLSYALGKQFSNPILLRAGKIHFGIVNYF